MVQHSGGALGLGMIAGILLTVWSANKGMKALMTALNLVYDEEERRGFIRLNAVSLLLTLCAILFGLIAVSLVIAVPALMGKLDLPAAIQAMFTYLRWPLLGIFLVLALSVAVPLLPGQRLSQMALGKLGFGYGNPSLASGIRFVLPLCCQLRQLQQNLRLDGSGHHPFDVVLSDFAHHPAGRGAERRNGTSDEKRFDRGTS